MTIKGILIDPETRTIREVTFADDKALAAEIPRLIGADAMGRQRINVMQDVLYFDRTALHRGEPIFAFVFGDHRDPYGGCALVIGIDDRGLARSPLVHPAALRRDLEWLGRILPKYETRLTITYVGATP